MKSKLPKILIVIIIFVLIAVGYYYFFGTNSDTTNTGLSSSNEAGVALVDSSPNGNSSLGGEFLATLLNLRTINLDGSLFQNPLFRNLKDFTIILVQPGNEGRTNPFAPLGSSSSSTSQQASSQFLR